jgi:GNAT superfamily N-acetyltransferase
LLPLIQAYYQFDSIKFDRSIIVRALEWLLRCRSLGRIWVIEGGTCELVGYGILTYNYDLEFGGLQGIITEFFITEPHRRQGLGVRMMRAIADFCRVAGISALELQVRRGNRPSFGSLTIERWQSLLLAFGAVVKARDNAPRIDWQLVVKLISFCVKRRIDQRTADQSEHKRRGEVHSKRSSRPRNAPALEATTLSQEPRCATFGEYEACLRNLRSVGAEVIYSKRCSSLFRSDPLGSGHLHGRRRVLVLTISASACWRRLIRESYGKLLINSLRARIAGRPLVKMSVHRGHPGTAVPRPQPGPAPYGRER